MTAEPIDPSSLASSGVDRAPEVMCARHPSTPTRLTCVECDTPMCPRCAIRTPVGFKCPDHATRPAPARRSRFAMVGVALAVVGVLAFAQLVRRTSVSQPVVPPCPTQPGPDVGIPAGGGGEHWRELSVSGLCGRYDASVVWTGTEMLVWGGESCAGADCPTDSSPHLGDGAGYRPATDAWRRLARSPLREREAAATVWTGSEMVVWGGTTGQTLLADGAAYDPARDSWRGIADSPLSPRTGSAAGWTGR